MKIYIQYGNQIAKPMTGQKYFKDYNWDHPWRPGDIVWMEDYNNDDYKDKIGALFLSKDTKNVVLVAIGRYISERMIEAAAENIKDVFPTWLLPKPNISQVAEV